MSNPKEPRFLVGFAGNQGVGPGDQHVIDHSIGTLEEYTRLFTDASGKKAIGEASVSTLFHYERSIPSIKRHLGDPRIIIILRDPVDSVYSTYNFLRRLGRETLSFEEALGCEEERKHAGYGWIWRYREARLYSAQVRAFQENFSKVLVLLYDDLKSNPGWVLRSICDFLDVDPDYAFDARQVINASGIPKVAWFNALFVKPKRLHKAARKLGSIFLGEKRWVALRERLMMMNLERPQAMPPEIARELRNFFREDVVKLQKLIGRDLGDWIDRKERNG